jgi:formylglycine-generating enzyme required for sulfatase activity
MNGKLPDVRMAPLEQQGVDTRQQEQANNSGRSNYTAIQPEMVRVNGGTFTMGCIDGRDKGCNATVKPAHEVTLSTFFIGKYEVTNAEFAVFLNDIADNPTRINYPRDPVEEHQWGLQKSTENATTRWVPAKGYEKYPVINVSWAWADAYCKWLGRQTGEEYRLPSEAEWEYAARGGQASVKNRFLYAGSDQIGEVAWYADNAKRTNPVGQKKPNQLDIYDMSGNVYEWCQDWYGSYTAGNQTNPGGPVSGRERVMRGGSFGMFEESLYLLAREKNFPNLSNQNLGFRVARTP